MCPRFSLPGLSTHVSLCLGWTVASAPVLGGQEHPVVELPPATQTLAGKEFSQIRGVSELTDGRVLVSDGLERSLYVVDFRSGDVRSVGTIGNGPGEFQYPGRLYPLGTDSALLTDQTTQKAFLVVRDSFPETLTSASLLIAEFGGEPPWGISRSGRVLGVQGFGYSGNRLALSRVEADSLRILLTAGGVFDWQPGELEKIVEVGGQGALGAWVRNQWGGREYLTSPLASEGQAWLFRDGWIALVHPDPYRVDWRMPQGEWLRGGPLRAERVPVTWHSRCFALTGDRDPGACDEPDLARRVGDVPWPDHLPPFVMARRNRTNPGGIAVQPAPNGMVLIQRTMMADSPRRRYDVVDRSGVLRGTVSMAETQIIVGSGSSSLFVVTRDEVDLLTLSRHPWPSRLGAG